MIQLIFDISVIFDKDYFLNKVKTHIRTLEIAHTQKGATLHTFMCQTDYPIDLFNLGIIVNQLEYDKNALVPMEIDTFRH